MASLTARLDMLERRTGDDDRPPRVATVIYHPDRPMPPHPPADTILIMPCNGRAPCSICDAEADRGPAE